MKILASPFGPNTSRLLALLVLALGYSVLVASLGDYGMHWFRSLPLSYSFTQHAHDPGILGFFNGILAVCALHPMVALELLVVFFIVSFFALAYGVTLLFPFVWPYGKLGSATDPDESPLPA